MHIDESIATFGAAGEGSVRDPFTLGAQFARMIRSAPPIIAVGRSRETHPEAVQAVLCGLESGAALPVNIGIANTELLRHIIARYEFGGGIFASADGAYILLTNEANCGREEKISFEHRAGPADRTTGSRAWTLPRSANFDAMASYVASIASTLPHPSTRESARRIAISADAASKSAFTALTEAFGSVRFDAAQPSDLPRLLASNEMHYDFGAILDGSGNITFFDETGAPLDPHTAAALLFEALPREASGCIVHGLRWALAVKNVAHRHGIRTVPARPDEKLRYTMAESGAAFGVDDAGVCHFGKLSHLPSGVASAMLMVELIANREEPLSRIAATASRGAADAVIASSNPSFAIQRVTDRFDGLIVPGTTASGIAVVETPEWRAYVEPKPTRGLLRISAEGLTSKLASEALGMMIHAVTL